MLHVLTSEHFAVVKAGDTIPLATCAVGPITQGAGQIRPHAQVTGVDGGHPYTVYSLWVDGGTDPEAGIPGFPMMANATSAGVGHLFAVFEPTTGLPPAPMPAVLFLHGGDGIYWNYRPSTSGQHQINLYVENGLYVTLDDNLLIRLGSAASSSMANRDTRWFGYCSQFDRFQPSNLLPASDEIVVNFTQRCISWVMDWLASARGVDPHRIALAGLSLGGHGTGGFCRVYPEKVSAALAFVMPVIPGEEPFGYAEWGKLSQQLATNLGVTYPEFDYPTTKVSPLDFPFARFVDGTADAVVPWFRKPTVYGELNSLRRGTAIYWDGRGHTAAAGTSIGTRAQSQIRRAPGVPRCSSCSPRPSPEITHRPPAARASVTLRRLQQFSASPFEPLPWTLTNASSGAPVSLPIAGITLLCDPGHIVASANLGADSSGYYFLITEIPPVPALTGTSVYCQTLWIDPCDLAGLSSSDGLRVTIVP